jgi:hypothetical protein
LEHALNCLDRAFLNGVSCFKPHEDIVAVLRRRSEIANKKCPAWRRAGG